MSSTPIPTEPTDAPMPDHVRDTVRAILNLHKEHDQQATTTERLVARLIAGTGRPRTVGLLCLLVTIWILLNLSFMAFGRKPWDAPPFYWLQGSVSLIALFTTILILTSQRRENELAVRREQLTLQLAFLSEQKTAKIIELLEEIREESPNLRSRVDPVARDMAKAADPRAAMNAIRDFDQERSSSG